MKIFIVVFLSSGLVISLISVYFSSGKNGSESPPPLNQIVGNKKILSGDIVFRLGHGFVSETLRKLSQKDQSYSHAGIISIEDGRPMVYHLIGGEYEATTLRRESLDKFCEPISAQSFALYRILLNDSQRRKVDSLNHYYYHCALPFDNQFDLTTDSTMYCTEFVYKILSRSGEGKFSITSSMLSGFMYIGCDDIYLNPACQKIVSFTYNKN
ncbi:MAG: hypothetical protein JJE25_11850 [Bacteroidia bacterium]|nr:hypothetical protein [Bacteroidia bacterium]